ncbi:MAG: substrate-binding domain-containing protein, partial [Actinoplanes sp.]
MTVRSRGFRALAVTAAVVLGATACSSGGREKTEDTGSGGGNAPGSSGYTIAFITHETPGDTFWDKIKNGAEQAAKDTGVTLKYSNDPEAPKQAVLIQNAVDSKVDGIA